MDWSQFFPNLLAILISILLGIFLLSAFWKNIRLRFAKSKSALIFINESNKLMLQRVSKLHAFDANQANQHIIDKFPEIFVDGMYNDPSEHTDLTFAIFDRVKFHEGVKKAHKNDIVVPLGPGVFYIYESEYATIECSIDLYFIPSYISTSSGEKWFGRYFILRISDSVKEQYIDEKIHILLSYGDIKGMIRFFKKEKPTAKVAGVSGH